MSRKLGHLVNQFCLRFRIALIRFIRCLITSYKSYALQCTSMAQQLSVVMTGSAESHSSLVRPDMTAGVRYGETWSESGEGLSDIGIRSK